MAVIPKKDKNRYKRIFHNLNIPMVIVDSITGNIGEVNIAACQYYGYSEKELLSMNVLDINVSNKEKIFKRIKQTKISDKIYTRSKHRLSTGEVRDVEVYSNFLEIGDEKLITSIIHDVNEKIKLEKDYLRDKAHFDVLFKNSNEAIAIVDNKFRVLETNESFKKMFQYSLSEIKNEDLTEKLCKTELYEDSYNFRESVANGKFVSEELKRYRKDGSELDVLVMGFPLESDGEVSGAYCIYSDITESKRQQDMIKTLSYKDTLTGLFNRDFFLKNLRNEILKKDDNEKNKGRLALILLSINEFKEVNDALGHLIADLLIKEFVVKLKSVVKSEYTIGRVAKDQIAIVIPNLRNINEISILTNTIIESFDSSFLIEMNELHITTNIGVSLYPDDGNDFITLVRKAEIAMDRSKENNKNSVAQFEKAYDSEIQENYWIKNDLLKAVESGELFLNYQPIYDINKNKLVGVESLVRWNHKEKGV
ncbi:MAG: PAS domain S-box protein, partial [Clostridium sp.]|nr:PAS domain S-box protein [Clostridium sp.]